MEFYPFGTLPASYPKWYVDRLAEAGMNAYASATWILSANDDDRFSSPAAHFLPMPPGYRLFRHGHPCYRFEVVIQGSLELGDGRIAKVGDVFTADPGTLCARPHPGRDHGGGGRRRAVPRRDRGAGGLSRRRNVGRAGVRRPVARRRLRRPGSRRRFHDGQLRRPRAAGPGGQRQPGDQRWPDSPRRRLPDGHRGFRPRSGPGYAPASGKRDEPVDPPVRRPARPPWLPPAPPPPLSRPP